MDLNHPETFDYDGHLSPDSLGGSPRALPADLPTSLNDRRPVLDIPSETEIYDPWQGQSQFLTTPVAAKPVAFTTGRSPREDSYADNNPEDNESMLLEMVAAQTAHRRAEAMGMPDVDDVALDEKLSHDQKGEILQKTLAMSASSGDLDRVNSLLNGRSRKYIDIDMPDEEGTVPLIYASCFGHEDVVSALLEARAFVNAQDRNDWTALMWAIVNRHKRIAKLLLDFGASPDIKSSSGGTASDFVQPGTGMSQYLHEHGYHFTSSHASDDFYTPAFPPTAFEGELQEEAMRERMMMQESAVNLEVDISSLGLNEKFSSDDFDDEDQPEFVWDRCLSDQMFVFQESELEKILDIVITNMLPSRRPSQKPIPANLLFLSARYAHYHNSSQLLQRLLVSTTIRINDVVARHRWDMSMLAFWIANATLLLNYLKKDTGLVIATVPFQQALAELVNEIFVLIIRDAERRMRGLLSPALLDHETIPGLCDVQFQNEWNIFRSKRPSRPESLAQQLRPPSPTRRAQVSPQNITSLLSSTLFVLELYDVHPVIISQILSQLFYWLGAELFNIIITSKHYMARTRAMQIRMNISALEDWARANNRMPDHGDSGSLAAASDSTVLAAQRWLGPVIQLLQWLQCLSSLGDDMSALSSTVSQLSQLTPAQLVHAAKLYRAEVNEPKLSASKMAMGYLERLQTYPDELERLQKEAQPPVPATSDVTEKEEAPETSNGPGPPSPTSKSRPTSSSAPFSNQSFRPLHTVNLETFKSDSDILFEPNFALPFTLPTGVDMLINYGAGFGGVNRERERKYIPTVPTEFLAVFDRD